MPSKPQSANPPNPSDISLVTGTQPNQESASAQSTTITPSPAPAQTTTATPTTPSTEAQTDPTLQQKEMSVTLYDKPLSTLSKKETDALPTAVCNAITTIPKQLQKLIYVPLTLPFLASLGLEEDSAMTNPFSKERANDEGWSVILAL
ncbi:hypothetical protein KEM56_005475 [Ascosphaera pollenicola]|nr:hypothetical protein KEM56_005475 [Ascosphaera pollenicola]